MGTVISISASCVKIDQGICGTVDILRSHSAKIERSEIGYVVDMDARIIALAPKICFRQSDAALSAEAVRDALSERHIDADTFAITMTSPAMAK